MFGDFPTSTLAREEGWVWGSRSRPSPGCQKVSEQFGRGRDAERVQTTGQPGSFVWTWRVQASYLRLPYLPSPRPLFKQLKSISPLFPWQPSHKMQARSPWTPKPRAIRGTPSCPLHAAHPGWAELSSQDRQPGGNRQAWWVHKSKRSLAVGF